MRHSLTRDVALDSNRADARNFVNEPIVNIVDVYKEYQLGSTVVPALRGVSLDVHRGEFISIAGPSGSGKTTLLNLIGCVDVATRGTVAVAGQNTAELSERELTRLRLNTIGFIFQSFNLVGVLSVFQNVEFPLLLQNRLSGHERRARVLTLLEQVGLAEHARHRPNELSGGQRQRVAVARALVGSPQIVLADEPTANLDSETGERIIDLMKEMNQRDRRREDRRARARRRSHRRIRGALRWTASGSC
jgi:putative ABC transport system ATP-binding protein